MILDQSSTDLKILAPNICKSEINWVIEQVFTEFLGISYRIEFHSGNQFIIENPYNSKQLKINSCFFEFLEKNWLINDDLPYADSVKIDCTVLRFSKKLMYQEIPVIFGSNQIYKNNNFIFLDFDIFGSIFFYFQGMRSVLILINLLMIDLVQNRVG